MTLNPHTSPAARTEARSWRRSGADHPPSIKDNSGASDGASTGRRPVTRYFWSQDSENSGSRAGGLRRLIQHVSSLNCAGGLDHKTRTFESRALLTTPPKMPQATAETGSTSSARQRPMRTRTFTGDQYRWSSKVAARLPRLPVTAHGRARLQSGRQDGGSPADRLRERVTCIARLNPSHCID